MFDDVRLHSQGRTFIFPPLASVGDREEVRTPGNSEPKVTGVAQCVAES